MHHENAEPAYIATHTSVDIEEFEEFGFHECQLCPQVRATNRPALWPHKRVMVSFLQDTLVLSIAGHIN